MYWFYIAALNSGFESTYTCYVAYAVIDSRIGRDCNCLFTKIFRRIKRTNTCHVSPYPIQRASCSIVLPLFNVLKYIENFLATVIL